MSDEYRHTDRITLTGLRIQAHHGVFDFERENGQEFVVDVTAWLDLAAASRADDLARTVNYGELAEEVTDAVATSPVDLIETVAERVANVVLSHEAVTVTEVTIHKPQAPISVLFGDVAVTIVRRRR
jgi:dihydroneopterin aldolase/dihydroneopterin aldolase/2-amino-4-hydroxy-6-hydroxymethyldihydropteridine diphosphokinase